MPCPTEYLPPRELKLPPLNRAEAAEIRSRLLKGTLYSIKGYLLRSTVKRFVSLSQHIALSVEHSDVCHGEMNEEKNDIVRLPAMPNTLRVISGRVGNFGGQVEKVILASN